VINKKIKYEKKYVSEYKKHLCQHQTLQTTSENEPDPESESEPEPEPESEQVMKHPRWSFTNSNYDPSSKYRFNISHKISPDIEDITPNSSGDKVASRVSSAGEYESVETYLYGLNEIHIRMIAKYYNIFYENSFITYLLDTKNIVNNAKNILFKWLYGNIDEYIYKYPTQTNNKQQHQHQKSIKNSHINLYSGRRAEGLPITNSEGDRRSPEEYGLGCLRTPEAFKVDALRASDPRASYHERDIHLSGLMPRIEVKSAFQPTNRILTTENPTMVVAVARQPTKLRSINESVPSDKITLSQRIYRIFSNMWRCFSIIIYFCWLITIRIFSG
jgi:hypothetical protein